MKTNSLLLIYCISMLLSCNKEYSDIEVSTNTIIEAEEIQIDFVDINNRHLAKERFNDFHIVAGSKKIDTYLVEREGKELLAFKPVLPFDSNETDTKIISSFVYMGSEVVAVIESAFRLDSMRLKANNKTLYYTNTENKVSSRVAESPVKLLVGTGFSYREEGLSKLCVTLNFPSAKFQASESIDYCVTINGFMGQRVMPIQKGLIVTENSDDTQNVVLAIEGDIHNYYNAEGMLQEPYDSVFEIASVQLFRDDDKHILKVTNSGDCYSNKIMKCNFDGQQLDLDSVVVHNSFGGEYINLKLAKR